jgi:hypothetical protein
MAADPLGSELLPGRLTPAVAVGLVLVPVLFFSALVIRGSFEPPGPPTRPPVTRVTGVVRLAGKPIPGGFLQIHPKGQTVGEHAITPISTDGLFDCERAPVGPVDLRLRITGDVRAILEQLAPPQRAALMRLAAVNSPLVWRTSADGPNRLELELLEAIVQPDLTPKDGR